MLKIQQPLSDRRSPMSTPSQADLTTGVMRAPDYEPAQYPDGVVNYRQYIIHEELPDDTREGSQLLVFIRKVNSPSEFWINLSGPLYSSKLNALCLEMRNFYELHHREYVMPPYAVVFGQFCVCVYRNEWHRARILNVSDSICEVSLVDFGGKVFMSHENLRFMHKKFSDLPMQSFQAEISDVKPRQNGSWPNHVCEWFSKQTSGRRFTAQVKDICSQKHLLKIKLFDGRGLSISHLLISADMAELKTPTVKSPRDLRELSPGLTKKDILSTAALAKVSTSQSRLEHDEDITLRSESSDHSTVTTRVLLHKQKSNSSTTLVSPSALVKLATSKTGLKCEQPDTMPRSEPCLQQTKNITGDSRESQHELPLNYVKTPLMKIPTSKSGSECVPQDSTTLSESPVNGSTNSLHKEIAFSKASRKVSPPKPRLESEETDGEPLNETRYTSWRKSLSIEDVTISGNSLLVVKLEGRDYFILSEFVHTFVKTHEHVVLKILDGLQSSVKPVTLPQTYACVFFSQLKGRTVAGLNVNANRQMPTVRLLPLCEVNELISFLKLDGSEIEDLEYFLLSLL